MCIEAGAVTLLVRIHALCPFDRGIAAVVHKA